ncbi:MAG TPA: anti-sigma factor [Gemmatimonadales bacterium]|jgi:anti-sigma-K factor RskA|nr:anti-sigma factor [Gemmatimonadales bacterium]
MTDHEWLALAAPYALDALDGDDRAAFEAHLAGCEQCRVEVASFREVAGQLALVAPAVEPAPGLRDRVIAEARRVRLLASRIPRPASRIPWLAAAAALVLALAAGYGYWRERGDRRALEQAVLLARDSLAARDSLLNAVLAPNVGTANLAATGKPPSARLFWNPARRVVVIAVFDLPPAPAGRTYQLWGIATGKAPVSLGVFNPGPNGRLTTALAVPAELVFQVTAVTEEPAGGSPQPTQTPFLIGEVRRSE